MGLAFSSSWNFYNTAVTNAVFGPDLTVIPPAFFEEVTQLKTITFDRCAPTVKNNNAFRSCTGVRDIWFIGEAIPTFQSTTFTSWNASQSRLHIPLAWETWRTWAAANVTPWADLTDDQRDSYWDKWPTSRKPLGRTTSSALPPNQWVLRWTEPGQPTVLILR